MADNEIKMCRDCKYVGRNIFMPQRLQYCYNLDVIKEECRKNPGGNGKAFADTERTFGDNVCGPQGKLWEHD